MNKSYKKLCIFFSGLAAFAALLIFSVNFWLKSVPGENGDAVLPLPPITDGDAPTSGSESPIKIIDSGIAGDPRPVTYTEEGFTPKEVTIKASDPTGGCVITVTNKTRAIIKVGLNPHLDAGDQGVDYKDLAPNDTGIYDVRYTDRAKAVLHNHYRPEHTFMVIYGEGCGL